MQPAELQPPHFATYPPLARQVAVAGLDVLRTLPLSFVPLLLGEVIAYDSKFPPERQEVDAQFVYLRSLTPQRRRQSMAGFEGLALAPELEAVDWVKRPGEFSERLSAHLWSSQQISTFRTAAVEFLAEVRLHVPPPDPVAPRLSVVILGQGVEKNDYPLFRYLRQHGTYFTGVDPQDGLRIAMQRIGARAEQHAIRYAHWYIDGGAPAAPVPAGVELLAYRDLDAVRVAVVAKMRATLQAGMGTEARRSELMRMVPEDVGLTSDGDERILNHFKVAIMSEGAGVQFFSTTFVQWAAREALRRAQPVTLLARFAPRMTEHSMNNALQDVQTAPVLDAQGALIDADMGAYYTWLNQSRLTGANASSFVAWFENHSEALVISPSTRRGVQSDQRLDLNQLLNTALR
jgi:hypothetical protein